MRSFKLLLVAGVTLLGLAASHAQAGSIFLTGRDPDFHAADTTGAQNINKAAISYILNPAFNDVVAADLVAGRRSKFLFVESSITAPAGHRVGKAGLIASGFIEGTDFDQVDAGGLPAALNDLGTTYAGIVISSDFGGLLTSAELDILNARSGDIIDFLNNDNGGLYAMAEGDGGLAAGPDLTPNGNEFGYLPFVVASASLNQSEAGSTVTAFGASLGLTNADVSSAFSHNVFNGTFGLTIVDTDGQGNILTLAGRGRIDPTSGLGVVPEPGSFALVLAGAAGAWFMRRRRRA